MFAQQHTVLKTALGIVRVSTAAQATEDHYSLSAQREAIQQWAARHGYTVVGWEELVLSGARVRSRLQAIRQVIRDKEIQSVVVFEWDRLSRDLLALMEFVSACQADGVEIISVAQGSIHSPEDHLAVAIHGSFAEYFRAQLARKTRAGLQRRMAAGLPISRPPFGYRRGPTGEWVVDPEEAAIVRDIFARYRRGEGRVRIARALNDAGHRTRQGKPWNTKTVGDVLGRRAYVGQVARKGETVPGQFPALIDPETWADVQEKRAVQARLGRHPVGASRYLFSGLLYCGACGSKMVKVGQRYICSAYQFRGACTFGTAWRVRDLEDTVWGYLRSTMRAARMGQLSEADARAWCWDDPAYAAWQQARRQALETLRHQADMVRRLDADYLAGNLNGTHYQRLHRHITQAVEAARSQVATPPPAPDPHCVQAALTAAEAVLAAAYGQDDQRPWRVAVRRFIRRITCHPTTLTITWGGPSES